MKMLRIFIVEKSRKNASHFRGVREIGRAHV